VAVRVIVALFLMVIAATLFIVLYQPAAEESLVLPLPENKVFPDPVTAKDPAPEEPDKIPIESSVPMSTPETVTWSGTVYEVTGKPAKDLKIEVKGRTPAARKCDQSVGCNHDGSFLFSNLRPGSYWVYLSFSSPPSTLYKYTKVSFKTPGYMERDIRLKGGAIEGVVIDGGTNQPIKIGRCWVNAKNTTRKARWVSAVPDTEGRFRIRGIASGAYQLTAGGKHIISTSISDIVVEEGQVTKDVVIVVPEGGVLYINPKIQHRYHTTLWRDGDEEPFYSKTHKFTIVLSYGTNDKKIGLPPGEWTALFDSEKLGHYEKRFKILSGSSISLEVAEEDFDGVTNFITVDGWLRKPEGSSDKEYIYLTFVGKGLGAWKGETRILCTGMDQEGRFSLNGFNPGSWKVTGEKGRHQNFHLPDLEIPESPPNPFPWSVTLPIGKITATFLDHGTGIPVNDQDPTFRWRAELIDSDTGAVTVDSQDWQTSRTLNLNHIPSGCYHLEIQATPFENYQSNVFSVPEGGIIDLGEIPLPVADGCGSCGSP